MLVTFPLFGCYGRLGNQLFQIVAALAYAHTWLSTVRHCDFVTEEDLIQVVKLPQENFPYRRVFPRVDRYLCSTDELDRRRQGLRCVDIEQQLFLDLPVRLPPDADTCVNLKGYFQSDQYFARKKVRVRLQPKQGEDASVSGEVDLDLIEYATRVLFSLKEEVEQCLRQWFVDNELDPKQCCAVHVRRGDYLGLSFLFPIPSIRYYAASAAELANQLTDNCAAILFFSDDTKWCRESPLLACTEFELWRRAPRSHHCRLVVVDSIDVSKDNPTLAIPQEVIELFAMSKCRGHVLSNSSFSWWSSALSESPPSMTVAPIVWFGAGDGDPRLNLDLRHHSSIYRNGWVRCASQ